MNLAVKTVLQALALGAIGTGAGLAANGLREDRLTVGRDYFPVRAGSNPTPGAGASGEAAAPGKPKHEFQVASLEDVVNASTDPANLVGQSDSKIFFIDARDDAHFTEGHIPGALQVDHYRLEKYLPDVLVMIENAQKLFVYCNGGECEDSILVCQDLMDAKVPYEKIYLFEGGMKAWKDANQPVE